METWSYILIGVAVFLLLLYTIIPSSKQVVSTNSNNNHTDISPKDLSEAGRIFQKGAMLQEAVQRATVGKASALISNNK